MLLLTLILSFLLAPASDLEARVEEVVSASFHETYGIVAARVDIDVVRVTGDLHPGDDLRIEWPDGEAPRGSVQLRVSGSDGAYAWALLRITIFDEVAQARRDLEAGETLDHTDLLFEIEDVTTGRGDVLTPRILETMLGRGTVVLSRSIRQGRPVRERDVRRPLATTVGDPVVMDYERGGILMRVSCVAREAGAEGSVVRLYSADTRTTYRARLTGAGTAQWIETR